MVVFCGEGKTGVPGEKPRGARTRTNNKLNPHMTPSPGIEPGPHWWEVSALTSAPSLLPLFVIVTALTDLKDWNEQVVKSSETFSISSEDELETINGSSRWISVLTA